MKFAFEAEFWPQTMKKTFNLTKVFRQSDPGATHTKFQSLHTLISAFRICGHVERNAFRTTHSGVHFQIQASVKTSF